MIDRMRVARHDSDYAGLIGATQANQVQQSHQKQNWPDINEAQINKKPIE